MSINPGYPDYARLVSESGVELLFNGFAKNATHTTGAIDCLGFAGILIEIQDFANPGNTTVKVQWFNNASLSLITDSQYFTPVPACNMSIKLPCLSRYCTITVTPVGAGQTGTTNYFVFGNNEPYGKLFTSQLGAPFLYMNQTVANGATATISATEFDSGSASWSVFDPAGTNWFATMSYYDLNTATFRQFASLDSTFEGDSPIRKVSIPPAPIQFAFTNQGAASTNVIMSVVMD